MSRERLRWLETQLNRDDLSDEEFDLYNAEANSIQDSINAHNSLIKEQKELKRKQEKEEAALSFFKNLSDEDVDELYVKAHTKYAGDINGVPFEEWFKKAQSFYTIDGNFVVHSSARSPKAEHVDSVQCVSLAHARYRVLYLILTKLRDHGERGYDFKWQQENITL